MQRKIRLLFLILSAALSLPTISSAQYKTGHATITFNDAARTGGFGSGGRSGRQIQTEIYYPAAAPGNNVPVLAGSWPVIVFGHGFFMSWDAYEPWYDSLSAHGYIVALPRTEGSASPVHTDFGKDLAIVAAGMQGQGALSTSLFYNKVSSKTAIAGHSMGGGAAYLSMQYTATPVACIWTMGAAQTLPSASAAAPAITVPNLLLSGSYDCVVPADTQKVIYNALASSCKAQVVIEKAYHCGFAAANTPCSFGEGTCMTAGGLARDTQLARSMAYVMPYLDFYLKGRCPAWNLFMQRYNNGYGTLTFKQQNCNNILTIMPAITQVGSVLQSTAAATYQWLLNGAAIGGATAQNYAPAANGSFRVAITGSAGCRDTSAAYTVSGLAADAMIASLNAFISPNPASDFIDLSGVKAAGAISIYDAAGQKILGQFLLAGTTRIDVRRLPSGIYTAVISGQSGCTDARIEIRH